MKVLSWGAGNSGQLSNGLLNDCITIPSLAIVPIKFNEQEMKEDSELTQIKIECGGGFSILYSDNEEIQFTGRNQNFELGFETSSDLVTSFITNPFLNKVNVEKVSSGWEHTLLLTKEGLVYGWGSNYFGQLSFPKENQKITQTTLLPIQFPEISTVCCGFRHSIILSKSGDIYGFGEAKFGQLGFTPTTSTPNLANDSPSNTPKRSKITRLLNNKKDSNIYEPISIPLTEYIKQSNLDEYIVQISCGSKHTLFLSNDGVIWAVGDNKFGQLGDSNVNNNFIVNDREFSFVKIDIKEEIERIGSGWNHCIAITKKKPNLIYTWGRCDYGQLGVTSSESFIKSPQLIQLPLYVDQNIKQFGVGSEHCIVLLENGKCLVWGWNEHGQLGLGDIENRYSPTDITYQFNNQIIRSVFAGYGHTFAITE